MTHRRALIVLATTVLACGPSRDTESLADSTSTSVSSARDTSGSAAQAAAVGSDSASAPSGLDALTETRTAFALEDGRSFTVRLREAELLTELPGSPSWLVFAGYECSDCDAQRQVWILRSDSLSPEVWPAPFSFPGEYADPETDSVYFRSRLFIGACQPPQPVSLVWLQQGVDTAGVWHRNIFRVYADSALRTERILWSDSLADAVVSRSRVGTGCKEVPGMLQHTW